MKLVIFVMFAALLTREIAAQTGVAVSDSVRKYKFLAKTARSKKDYAQARIYYGQLLVYSPTDLQAHFFLGDMNFRLRNIKEARSAFGSALSLDSLHINSNLRLYSLHTANGRADSAARCLRASTRRFSRILRLCCERADSSMFFSRASFSCSCSPLTVLKPA